MILRTFKISIRNLSLADKKNDIDVAGSNNEVGRDKVEVKCSKENIKIEKYLSPNFC